MKILKPLIVIGAALVLLLAFAALSERTIVLDEGKVVADDATSSIMSNIALLERHGLAPASRIIEAQAPGSNPGPLPNG